MKATLIGCFCFAHGKFNTVKGESMEDKKKTISITEKQLKLLEDEFCLTKFENKAKMLESFLYDYFNYNKF